MYVIVEKNIYNKTKMRYYLTNYNAKEKIASYSPHKEEALEYHTRREADELNNIIPDTINGLVITTEF